MSAKKFKVYGSWARQRFQFFRQRGNHQKLSKSNIPGINHDIWSNGKLSFFCMKSCFVEKAFVIAVMEAALRNRCYLKFGNIHKKTPLLRSIFK